MNYAELSEIVRREAGVDIAARILAAICREAAGEYVYIPRRSGPPEILPGDTPAKLAIRYGVTKRTAYNWVARWK